MELRFLGLLDVPLAKASTGATNEDIVSERVPDDEIWRIEEVAARDVTSPCTTLLILISQGGTERHVVEEQAPAANQLYWHDQPFYLAPNTYLVFRFTGSSSADDLRAYFRGRRYAVPGSQGGGSS